MCNYAGVFYRRMNAVIYFSCTGRSETVAKNIAQKTGFELLELTKDTLNNILSCSYNTAVIVFPVHCQSYPKPMKKFFKGLKAENVALVATYGSAHKGNALYEAAKLLGKDPIAAAYVPCNHSYSINEISVSEWPQEFFDKIKPGEQVKLPKLKKTAFAGVLPELRSRSIIKIKRNDNCNKCGECNALCPTSAMNCGKPNGNV